MATQGQQISLSEIASFAAQNHDSPIPMSNETIADFKIRYGLHVLSVFRAVTSATPDVPDSADVPEEAADFPGDD